MYDANSAESRVGKEAEEFFRDNIQFVSLQGWNDYRPIGLLYSNGQQDLHTMAVELGIDGLVSSGSGFPKGIDVKHLALSPRTTEPVFKFQVWKENGAEGAIFNPFIQFFVYVSPSARSIYILKREQLVNIFEEDVKSGLVSLDKPPLDFEIPLTVKKTAYGRVHKDKKSLWGAIGPFDKNRLKFEEAFKLTERTVKEAL